LNYTTICNYIQLFTVEAAKILAGGNKEKSQEVLPQAPMGSINMPGTDIPGLSKAPRPAATKRATRRLLES